MKKHEYIARRPFAADEPGTRLVQPGEVITIKNKPKANNMKKKGLIYPNYKTKEDKEAMKVQKPSEEAHIEHDAGGMYYIMQGDKVIDRKRKSEAEQIRDNINGVSA